MKQIPLRGKLGQGRFALVDDEDYASVESYKWYLYPAGGRSRLSYVYRVHYLGKNDKGTNKNKKIYLSRLILEFPMGLVDHVNGDTLDNRRCNLRISTRSQNNCNVSKRKSRQEIKSKYIGVCWYGSRNRWLAQVTYGDKHFNLGYFQQEKEAAMNRDYYALRLHGSFAKLNFPGCDYNNFAPKRKLEV